jgi:hypothetical protein
MQNNYLASSKTLVEKLERAKGIQFNNSMEGAHNFVIVYNTLDKITNPVSTASKNIMPANGKI